MYVLLKTHKFAVNEIQLSVDIVDKCKVRPIAACCSSPTEKLAWLCTYILTPSLDVIPCHGIRTLERRDSSALITKYAWGRTLERRIDVVRRGSPIT